MLRTYYQLTKPGIIYGNLLTAAAGFLLASRGHINFGLFLALLAGTSLVIAAACVFNNYIDRGIDSAMARTRDRALVNGTISGTAALTFATVLFILGVAVLILWCNRLTLIIGLIAFVDYVVLYGWTKRRTSWSTIVGSVSGSAPVVAGYVAVTNRLDAAALILFLILTFWQMPHFYAIAIYRLKDYTEAHLPVLPVARGIEVTRRRIIWYVIAFTLATVSLTIFAYAGYTYLIIMLLVSLVWLYRGVKGFRASDSARWARGMFFFSLIVILVQSVMLAVGSLLP